jgi:hypothetical protein
MMATQWKAQAGRMGMGGAVYASMIKPGSTSVGSTSLVI